MNVQNMQFGTCVDLFQPGTYSLQMHCTTALHVRHTFAALVGGPPGVNEKKRPIPTYVLERLCFDSNTREIESFNIACVLIYEAFRAAIKEKR